MDASLTLVPAASAVRECRTRPESGSGRDYRDVIGTISGLRRGISTGTCAQAAAKAAALALATGVFPRRIDIMLPEGPRPYSGARVSIPVTPVGFADGCAVAGVVNDAGDGDDSADGLLIVAQVRARAECGVRISAGRGVGLVTRPRLPDALGTPAIAAVTRAMIRRELEGIRMGGGGFEVVLEVPEGERIAAKSWNPCVRVSGGIPIAGASGVVEPARPYAFRKTIPRAVRAAVTDGVSVPALALGYVGEGSISRLGLVDGEVVLVGDHAGTALLACARMGARGVILIGPIGKMAKVAAGIFDTSGRFGDAQRETLAAHAGAAGAPAWLVDKLLSMSLAENAAGLLAEQGYDRVFTRVAKSAAERSWRLCGLPSACTILSPKGGELASYPEGFWRERT